jgi:predicted ferric reductase
VSRDGPGRAIDERWLHSLRHGYTNVLPTVQDRRSFDAEWVDGHWSHDVQPSSQPRAQPPATKRTGRVVLTVIFWLVIATSLALWWLNTPAGSINDTASLFLAIGRITGMVGGVVLLLQILSMSRVGWLERWVGGHDLMVWHRELGGYLLIMILTHMAATVVGYAAGAQVPILSQTWSMISADFDMVTATIATALLVAVALLSMRALRRRMSYETWYHLHLASYLVVILGYGHQFSAGQELMEPGFGRVFWNWLYAFVAGCLLWGRLIGPLWLNARHRLRIAQVVTEMPGIVSIYIGGRRLDRLKARAGQYFRWRFLTRGRWWQAHPFSLSAAPNGEWLRLTVKMVGDHTRDLQHLREGVRVFAEGPSGVFTADRSVRKRALLIAGGSGIAPIRALLEDLPPGTIMIYRARSADELVFREELEWLARERGAFIWFVLGGRDEPGPRNLFTPKGLHDLVPDVFHRDIFLCGPPALVEASVKVLRRLRIPRRQIHLDPFEF